MDLFEHVTNRRRFLSTVAYATTAVSATNLFAEELTRTPRQTPGPFFPDRLPLDTDNDLLIINDSIKPSVGQVTHLSGKILTENGSPLRNALVEVWQVDNEGSYLHSRGANPQNGNKRDANFQGYGKFLTSSTGEYYFRTIKPVSYPGRTPHIHYKVSAPGQPDFVTQCYIKGHPQNARDGVLQRSVRDPKGQAALMADFQPLPNWRTNELTAKFNVVLGVTPRDAK